MTLVDSPDTSICTATSDQLIVPTALTTQGRFELVAFDLYRDIHKGLRAELFAITSSAGCVDPSDRCGRFALADHVASVAAILEEHAAHEDDVIQPLLVEHAPQLAERIAADHLALDPAFDRVADISQTFAAAATDERRLGHLLHLELTGFTSAYLAHQLVEERRVMPALEQVIGVDAVIGVNLEIVGSIPPERMAQSLAFMLPAMNLDDRTEMLDGMRMSAPPEAFAGIVSLAGSVLDPSSFASLSSRLGLD